VAGQRNTWIFQANPQRFDLDKFLAINPAKTSWLVTRNADRMQIGDQVFLWRAVGKGDKLDSGVFAEAEIISDVTARPDDPEAAPFWSDPSEATAVANRVTLRVVRIANKRQVLKREWLKEDPILRTLAILKMASATNYEIAADHARRLNALLTLSG